MSSITVQSGFRNTFTCPSFTPHQSSPLFKPLNPTVVALKQRAFSSSSSSTKCGPIRKFRVLSSSATAEADEEEIFSVSPAQKAEAVGKPRIVLKFVWMEKNIGLALDQVLPGHGTVPLSPYFFWPRKDAWEELKTTLESKPWITQKKMIILLNQATDIINLWQQSGGNLPSSS